MVDGYHAEHKIILTEDDSRAMSSSRFTILVIKKRQKRITKFSKFRIASLKNVPINTYEGSDALV